VNRPAAVTAVVLAFVAAGCGGSSSPVRPTGTTDGAPTAPPPITAITTPSRGALAEDDLPPPDAIGGLAAGQVRRIDAARSFVDVLYRAGDPTKPAVAARLEASGFAGVLLRDQQGLTPATGITLFRSYAFVLRDEAAARAEVAAAVAEVRASMTEPTTDIDLADLPGARGLRVDISQAAIEGAAVFATFAVGPNVYGLQGVATSGASLPQDEIVQATRDLYERVTATR
jgi:hypothetical protein